MQTLNILGQLHWSPVVGTVSLFVFIKLTVLLEYIVASV